MSLPCELCGINENDELIFGELSLEEEKHMLHRNCLIMCMGKFVQNKRYTYREWSFLKRDLSAEKRRFKEVKCSYCPRLGANLACSHARCTLKFHTKCGLDNLAVLQYGGSFDCFCAQHAPQPSHRPEPEDECVLCLAPVVPEGGAFSAALAFQAPCCQGGWFHRVCLQEHSNATTIAYSCPLCREIRGFCAVAMLGVSVPKWRFYLPTPPSVESSDSDVWARGGALHRGPRILHSRPIPYEGRAPRIPAPRPYIP